MNSKAYYRSDKFTVRLLGLFLIALLGSGCAILPSKSNDDKLAKLSGKTFVISVANPDLKLDLVLDKKSADQSIYRLVSDQDYPLAFVSNGQRDSGPLKIEDPSNALLNGLNKYFQKKYQFKFVAKGTISNIDPKFIQKALKKGDYVVDVRVSELSLTANPQKKFYLSAAFQFSVIDRTKGKLVLQDTCYFAEPENAQNMHYFSDQRGARIAQVLRRNANACLQYFAQGTGEMGKPVKVVSVKTQRSSSQTTSESFLDANLGTGVTYYTNYPIEPLALVSTHAGIRLGKSVTKDAAFILELQTNAANANGFPTFVSGTTYGGTAGAGVDFGPDGTRQFGYRILARGQMGQFRQNGIRLSTNAIGVGIGVYRPLFSSVYANADYTLWLHAGATEESNRLGHALGVGLSYRFD